MAVLVEVLTNFDHAAIKIVLPAGNRAKDVKSLFPDVINTVTGSAEGSG
jgi:hypothetical protein